MKHFLKHLIRSTVIWVCCIAPLYASIAADKEQLVKAGFIYNFTKFIAWPDGLDIANQSNINICIIGSNSLGDAVNLFKKGSTSQLTINAKVMASSPASKGECHIAFVSSSEKSRLGSLTKDLIATSTLAVSDIDGFAEKGGMIEFATEDNKIKLIVNRVATEQAHLKADTQLLEIAQKVIQ